MSMEQMQQFNEQFPSGSPVILTDDFRREHKTRTIGSAWLTGSGDAIVKVEGITGGYDVARLKAAYLGIRLDDDGDTFIDAEGRSLGEAYYYPDGKLSSEDATVKSAEQRSALSDYVADYNRRLPKSDIEDMTAMLLIANDELKKQLDCNSDLRARIDQLVEINPNNYVHEDVARCTESVVFALTNLPKG